MTKNGQSKLGKQILNAIEEVVGPPPVMLHEPCFKGNEWSYLEECLRSTFVSSVGKFVDRFEIELANYTGAKHAVAMVNGTAALHIALKLGGVIEGDEVLVPAFTFVATANAVAYCGAIPHFIESEESTLGVDPGKLREYLSKNTTKSSGHCVNVSTGRTIRALVPMHTFGHPMDIEEVASVAKDFGLVLIEDAAESLGSSYKGQHTGTFGKMGILSFNGNKIITTGGGGALLTNDSELAMHAKHLSTTAKIAHQWEYQHDEIGYNYRMPNLNAALGCAQLEQLPSILARKRELYDRYHRAFKDIAGVELINEPAFCSSNFWLQALLLDRANAQELEPLLYATNSAGIMTRPAWRLLNDLEPFEGSPSMDLQCARSLTRRLINIPSSSYAFE